MNENSLISQLFKSEYSKIIAVLCKLFGIKHIEIAEDITNETFLLANETWALKGIPENPSAWLYTVAKNKTKDYFKRQNLFTDKIIPELNQQNEAIEIDLDLSNQNIKDSQLQMIFTLCNPVISTDAQIGLALRILCGFGIDEIASAFLSNKETINKRLFRAKEKLRNEQISIETFDETTISERLETVLSTLYLLFNEGYHSNSHSSTLRKEMCLEAMRLTYFLIENKLTNRPNVNALMAIMCFHSSRFEARLNELGETILYDDQDRNLWNEELIEKGNYFLIESAKGQTVSKYHLEASIAYWHATKIENPAKWDSILQLYNQLLQIEYSPITAMNRTYAFSKVYGDEKALIEAKKLALEDNHFYHTLLGKLNASHYVENALRHFEIALKLAKSENDIQTIKKHIIQLK